MKRSTALLLVLSLLMAGAAYAQSSRGAIAGTVKDSSGAVVPSARITVTNTATGATLEVVSQSNGSWLAPQLLSGDYRITVVLDGFKRVDLSPVKVDVSTTITQDLTLEPGAVSERITVEAETSQVETTSGRLATTVEVKQVLEMPLVDRNVFNLVNLVPGAFFNRDTGAISLGGGRAGETSASLDGAFDSRGGLGSNGTEVAPPVDAVQEFKVEVNNMSAEFGRSTGGMLNAVTRSGTNRFTGAFYEFVRNQKFDAAGWNADAKPPLRRNNFGATVGGPIRRNRTFFFYNNEALIDRRPNIATRNVGLPEWRTGNFSSATRDAGSRAQLVTIYDPDSGTGTFLRPLATTPFPGNTIPAARLDPVAVKALAYVPKANRTPDNPFNNSGNWRENLSDKINTDLHTARIDHQLRPGTTIFGRLTFHAPNRTATGVSDSYGPADPNLTTVDTLARHLVLSLTHVFSPTLFLNASAGLMRTKVSRLSAGCCDTNYGQTFGLPNLPGGQSFPRFDIQGGLVPMTEIGSSNIANRIATFTNFDYKADLTKVAGRHTFKTGANLLRYNGNDMSWRTPSGRFYFTETYTRGIEASGAAVANTGIRLADFLLGRLNRAAGQVSPTFGRRIQAYAGYFQDDFRLTPNLTLNLGIRYETETPQYEVNNRFSGFNPYQPSSLAGTADIPKTATGVILFAGRNGQGQYLTRWDKNNLAPRFGFAWRPRGSATLVVRGGYGLYYGNPYSQQTIQRLRAGFEGNYDQTTPSYLLRNGLPAGATDAPPTSELTPTFGMLGTRFARSDWEFLSPDRATPYTHNYNLTVQRQVRGILFEVAYLANLSRHTTFNTINLNTIAPEMLSRTDLPERQRRPFTVFSGAQATISEYQPTWGISNYHAFTFKSQQRFRGGLGWTLAYTFSKWIDNVPSLGGEDDTFGDNDNIQNPRNLRAERSLSTNHVPHRLVLAPIVELPFGKGRRWMNRGGLLNAVLGGWELATIGALQSGSPFGVTVLNGGRDVLGDVAQTLRSNLAGGALGAASQGTPAVGVRGIQWLNAAAFAVPARFTYGNASRTLPGVLSPGLVNFDTMMSKNFRIRERFRLQFRWEMFNAFNTPYFGQPAQDLGGGGFGIISAAGNRRIMQFGTKLYW
jgi:hypothetical protein